MFFASSVRFFSAFLTTSRTKGYRYRLGKRPCRTFSTDLCPRETVPRPPRLGPDDHESDDNKTREVSERVLERDRVQNVVTTRWSLAAENPNDERDKIQKRVRVPLAPPTATTSRDDDSSSSVVVAFRRVIVAKKDSSRVVVCALFVKGVPKPSSVVFSRGWMCACKTGNLLLNFFMRSTLFFVGFCRSCDFLGKKFFFKRENLTTIVRRKCFHLDAFFSKKTATFFFSLFFEYTWSSRKENT